MAIDLYPNKTSTTNVPSVEFKGSGFNIRNNTVIKVLTTLMVTDNGKQSLYIPPKVLSQNILLGHCRLLVHIDGHCKS